MIDNVPEKKDSVKSKTSKKKKIQIFYGIYKTTTGFKEPPNLIRTIIPIYTEKL